MEDWIILTKFIIFAYCGLKYCSGNLKNAPVIIFIILVYVCLNMLLYVFKKEVLKNIFSIALIIFILICSFNFNPLFFMFLPLNLIEFISRYYDGKWIPALISFFPSLVIDSTLILEYLIITSFCLIIFILIDKITKRIDQSSKEIDLLKEKNNLLQDRLDRDSEYAKQVKYSSQLEERNKIAQEIHDRIGHSIAGSLMQLEAAKLLIEDDHGKAQDIIQNVTNTLRTGMESIRTTLRNIKPVAEQIGINRLKLLLEEFSVNNKIKTSILYKGDLEIISHIQWKIMHENLKEALTNALKYSKSSTIHVNIEVLNKFIKTEIKDNGVGANKIKKGLGLSGIEERTENSGGKVIIDGSNGFSIITLMPIGG